MGGQRESVESHGAAVVIAEADQVLRAVSGRFHSLLLTRLASGFRTVKETKTMDLNRFIFPRKSIATYSIPK